MLEKIIDGINKFMLRLSDLCLKIGMKEQFTAILFEPWIRVYFKHEEKFWKEMSIKVNKINDDICRALAERILRNQIN